ncbi:hypothetical protein JCM15640A_06120 [Hoylesella timonensis 4401737 = DSM 22865 = JCM 15640]
MTDLGLSLAHQDRAVHPARDMVRGSGGGSKQHSAGMALPEDLRRTSEKMDRCQIYAQLIYRQT